jgi:hypothetical protein
VTDMQPTEDSMHTSQTNPVLLGAVKWRCIDPPRGGRVVAVPVCPVSPLVFYFGGCAGGVWKTPDGGTYWENVSDRFFETSAVGLSVQYTEPLRR